MEQRLHALVEDESIAKFMVHPANVQFFGDFDLLSEDVDLTIAAIRICDCLLVLTDMSPIGENRVTIELIIEQEDVEVFFDDGKRSSTFVFHALQWEQIKFYISSQCAQAH